MKEIEGIVRHPEKFKGTAKTVSRGFLRLPILSAGDWITNGADFSVENERWNKIFNRGDF